MPEDARDSRRVDVLEQHPDSLPERQDQANRGRNDKGQPSDEESKSRKMLGPL